MMMFNEAMNSWEKPAVARPGQQLSSVFPAAGMETGKGSGRRSSAPPCARNRNLIEVLGQFALFFFQIPPGARRTSMSSSLSAGTLCL